MNTLKSLYGEWGQSIWLDFIDRRLVTEGGLERFRVEDGVRGVTSNPSIFQQAIASKGQYDQAVAELLADDASRSTVDLYEALAVDDIRAAADILRPVYDDSGGGDGFVSLEVSPRLARDTAGTVAEARRLWGCVDRPNLMIKVPATSEGIPAIEELIADCVNVNATLIFSIGHYEAVAGAYLAGVARCEEPGRVASVASFFVSRLDSAVDRWLEEVGTAEALALRGGAAVANARLAYRRFEELFGRDRFAALAARGARVQRPLWASTSTKNPAYRDVIYVEELIGPDTVNTLPMKTLEAFRDHGRPRQGVTEDVDGAQTHLESLAALGLDLEQVTETLQVDGVAAFAASFEQLLESLAARRSELTG
jgi:transaldolase